MTYAFEDVEAYRIVSREGYSCGKSEVKLWFTVATRFRPWHGAKLLSSRRSVGFECVGRFGAHWGTGPRGDSIPSMATGPARQTTFAVESAVPTASGWTTGDISTPARPKDNTKTHHNRGELPHRGFDARKTNRSIRAIARIPYPAVGVVFWSCIWTGASEHYAVAGGFG